MQYRLGFVIAIVTPFCLMMMAWPAASQERRSRLAPLKAPFKTVGRYFGNVVGRGHAAAAYDQAVGSAKLAELETRLTRIHGAMGFSPDPPRTDLFSPERHKWMMQQYEQENASVALSMARSGFGPSASWDYRRYLRDAEKELVRLERSYGVNPGKTAPPLQPIGIGENLTRLRYLFTGKGNPPYAASAARGQP